MRIAVLGAGTVGTCSAWYLAQQGHEVTVIERQLEPALETSWGNGCVLHASEAEPWSQPGMPRKILSWLGREDAPLLLRYGAIPRMWRWGLEFAANCTAEKFLANALANLDLALLSLRSVKEILDATGIECDNADRGVIKIFRDKASLDAAEANCRLFAGYGLLYERVSPQRALQLEPALKDTVETLVGGLYFARDEVADCNKFTSALARHAAERGVTFRFHTHVEALRREGGRITGVQTSQGFIPADSVVVALGSWSAPFLKTLGVRVLIYPVKGISITMPRDDWETAPSMPVIDDSKLFGFVPVGDRLRISGSAEIAGYDSVPASSRAQAILDNTCDTFPELGSRYDATRSRVWAGLRPVAAAGTPLIGQSSLPGVWINSGHGHLGWTLAAGSGRFLASLVDGNDAGLRASSVKAFQAGIAR